ncbi:MAG: hypothetical protein AB7V62_07925 [Thermoleophilia bacterium]
MAARRMRAVAAAVAAGVVLGGAAAAEAAIRDIPMPVPAAGLSTYPWDRPIASWEGAIWVAAENTPGLVRIGMDGAVSQVPVPRDPDDVSQEGPSTLSPGAEGLWFLNQAGSYSVFLRADGTFNGFQNTGFNSASTLVARPAGGVYAASNLGEWVRYVSPQASREYPREHGDQPVMAIGADGLGWVAGEGLLMRLDDSGGVTPFPLVNPCTPSAGCALPAVTGMALGPDGRLWYTRSGLRDRATGPYAGTTTDSAVVGRMDARGRAREWDLANRRISPSSITRGPDGAMWFATADGLGRVTTSGRVRLLRLPGGRTADSIAFGPDRAIWFTDARLNRVSRITMREANALGGAEIRATALRRRGTTVPVRITCPPGGPRCAGRVVLSTVPNPDAVFGRGTTYGRRAFALRAGRSATVAVPVTGRARTAARLPVRVEIARGVPQGDVVDLTLRR